MKHRVEIRAHKIRNLFEVRTVYEYKIVMPKYMKEAFAPLNLAGAVSSLRTKLNDIEWERLYGIRYCIFSVKSATLLGQELVVQLVHQHATYDKSVELRFKKQIDLIYREFRDKIKERFIVYLVRHKKSYRGLPTRSYPRPGNS